MDLAVGISLISCLEAEIHAFEVWRPSSWTFSLPVWSYSILTSPYGKLDPENIGIAIGISLTSRLGAEIHALEVKRPPSWIFPLSVLSHSIRISPSGMLDLKNVRFALKFRLYLVCCPVWKRRYTHLKFFWPPSWIFPLPVESHSIHIHPNGEMDPKSR